jgi:hypothetical protein
LDPSRQNLVHYFFVMRGPDRSIEDESGAWLVDSNAAFAHAQELVEDLKSEEDFDYRGWELVVQDALARPIFSIPF